MCSDFHQLCLRVINGETYSATFSSNNQYMWSCPTCTPLFDPSYKLFIMEMILWGMSFITRNFHMNILWMQTKAFRKSTNFRIIDFYYSSSCSIIILSIKILSEQPFPWRKPACCSLNFVSVKPELKIRLCLSSFSTDLDTLWVNWDKISRKVFIDEKCSIMCY